jgi:hypothetical protein
LRGRIYWKTLVRRPSDFADDGKPRRHNRGQILVVWGLLWVWHQIRRYRLAVGLAGLIVGFGITRFISLHEVIAWNAAAPWARTAVDLIAATGGCWRWPLPASCS